MYEAKQDYVNFFLLTGTGESEIFNYKIELLLFFVWGMG